MYKYVVVIAFLFVSCSSAVTPSHDFPFTETFSEFLEIIDFDYHTVYYTSEYEIGLSRNKNVVIQSSLYVLFSKDGTQTFFGTVGDGKNLYLMNSFYSPNITVGSVIDAIYEPHLENHLLELTEIEYSTLTLGFAYLREYFNISADTELQITAQSNIGESICQEKVIPFEAPNSNLFECQFPSQIQSDSIIKFTINLDYILYIYIGLEL